MAMVSVAVLEVVGGPAAGATVYLATELTFGRDEHPAGVSFQADATMAAHHARFTRFASGAVMVTDLRSGSGTWVGGKPVTLPSLLQVGDLVKMGSTVVRFDNAFAEVPADALVPEVAGGPPGARGGDTTLVTVPSLPTPPPGSAPGVAAAGVSDRVVAAAGVPGRGGPAPGHRWPWVAGAAVALAVAVVAFAIGHATAARPSAAPDSDQAAQLGTVYVESGGNRPDSNAILAYQYRAGGDLQPLEIGEVPTGGSAGFDLSDTGALDADGQVILSPSRHLLFAVNQGSDTIAVFHVLAGGSLRPVAGSPFPSGGRAPASVAIAGNRLVVVNKAQDGVRDLTMVIPNVATFTIEPSGALRPTGSVVPLPTSSSPTEALVVPDGKVVIVPEEHGPLASLTLGPNGELAEAPGSPYALPAAIFPAGFPADQQWVLGLSVQPRADILYAQIVNTAQLAVYQFDDSGRLSFVRAVADPGAYLPCWSVLNAGGTRLYTDNAGNNTMSVFDLADPLNPHQIEVAMLKNAGTPWDLRMDPTGRFMFVLDPRDRADLVPPGSGNELHTMTINGDGTLTEPAYSPVPIPVPLNTNPIGLAVGGA